MVQRRGAMDLSPFLLYSDLVLYFSGRVTNKCSEVYLFEMFLVYVLEKTIYLQFIGKLKSLYESRDRCRARLIPCSHTRATRRGAVCKRPLKSQLFQVHLRFKMFCCCVASRGVSRHREAPERRNTKKTILNVL